MLTRRHLLATAAMLPLARLAWPTTVWAADDRAMPAPGRRAWADKVPVIRIGILGGENDADRLGRYGAYQKLLEDTFKVPVKLLLAADYAGVIQGFAAGQIEASYMSPAAYAGAWMESHGNVIPILTTEEKDGSTSYVAAMYVRADSNIQTLADMKGRSIAWADPNSASGYLIPRAELRAKGIDPDKYFGRTGFAGGHEQAVVAVLGRQYDAGVAWTSGIGDRAKGFTRGALRLMVDHGLLDMSKLRIIWESRPIMNGPFVLRADTPAEFRADMLAFHRALPVHFPEIYHQVDMGQGRDWVPVTHADYQLFVDMRKAEAAARRRR
jgi:phosphonate transport system substrate-binding protein